MEIDVEREQAKSAIEAVLFTMGGAVELKLLAAAVELETDEAKELVEELAADYDTQMRGMKIIELDGNYQMCTRKEYYEALIRVASQPKRHVLTDVVLETLSIIAYKQPITRTEIEQIRGVKSDHAVNKLVEYGLIEEAGRLNAPGRPILFRTTENFLRSFGLPTLDELPVLGATQLAEFEEEAAEEIQLELNFPD
ncbi:MAG: SMC-Scp complex subunit ScpB [Lachnospiraceae bacterium]|nr:SMC-Scp complex subunit ScpB [Lachnospiraceae bacterium]